MLIEYSDEFVRRVVNLKPGSMNVMIALDMCTLDTVKEHLETIAKGSPITFIEMIDEGEIDELRDYLLSMEEARNLLVELAELIETAELKAKYVIGYID